MKGLNDKIAELEKEKCELLGIIQGKDNAIQDLQKENAELKEELKDANEKVVHLACKSKSKQLAQAKEIIKDLLTLNNDHYGNTKMEWRVKVTEQAEQFSLTKERVRQIYEEYVQKFSEIC
jgi:hypothetical protein